MKACDLHRNASAPDEAAQGVRKVACLRLRQLASPIRQGNKRLNFQITIKVSPKP